MGFNTQKQFLVNTEDAMNSPVDIPSSINRYQKMLQYASTPLDYVCQKGLYLMPSDMTLHPGGISRYNNLVQMAGSDAVVGHNPGINEAVPINPASKVDKALQRKSASPAGTVHMGPPSGRPAEAPTSAAVAPVVVPADWKSSLDH